MARAYKRDSRGRFAGGGGSSGSRSESSGGRKQNKSRVTTTGTFLTRGKAKVAQQKRTKQFSSKTQASGARDAWKKASGRARQLRGRAGDLRQRGNALMSGGRRDGATVNVSLSTKTRRQPLSMEQRKAKLLQVHGKAIERDLATRKGMPRYQVRDMLDSASAATVVRNVKKWVAKNRGSLAAGTGSTAKPKARRSKPAPLRSDYVEVVASNKRRLQWLNRQIRQGGPGTLQLRTERRMLRVKIAGLESQGRRR